MKILNIPHKTADYLCPVNGLCDMYEWKSGSRLPDQLMHGINIGFNLISNKYGPIPKMINLGSRSIGKQYYDFMSECIGYDMICDEGKKFDETLKAVINLVDNDIPAVIFGLDMYYLKYQEMFYNKVHIEGHIILMVGYDEENIYILDNSKEDVQKVNFEELKQAWSKDYLGISKKNCYFGMKFNNLECDRRVVLTKALRKNAEEFLNLNGSSSGVNGLDMLINEFHKWNGIYGEETMRQIYINFIMFTSSVVPSLPKELDKNAYIEDSWMAGRDKMAAELRKNYAVMGCDKWLEAAELFEQSGKIIRQINKGFLNDVMNSNFKESEKYILLFKELKKTEIEAQKCFL